MTKAFIKKQMYEIHLKNQLVFRTFYIRYTSDNKNVIITRWGEMCNFEDALTHAENSSDKIGDNIPIELLVLIDDRRVYCWTKNPLWNIAEHPEECSHVYTDVPLVGKQCFIDPKDWLDIDNRKLSEPMCPAETPVKSPMNVRFLQFFKNIFKKFKM